MVADSKDLAPAKDAKGDEIETIINHLSQLCFNEELADVTFITEDAERVPGHRQILAARSEYFRTMLNDGLAKTAQNEIKVRAPAKALKLVLKYLYSGRVSLVSIEKETLVAALTLAHQYGVESLAAIIEKHLEENLSVENVGAILIMAQLFGLDQLTESCLSFMERKATEIFEHESFLEFPRKSLCVFLGRGSIQAAEIEIFRFVQKWLERNSEERSNAEEVVSLICFSSMTDEQLLSEVAPSGLVDPQGILDALLARKAFEKLVEKEEVPKRTLKFLYVSILFLQLLSFIVFGIREFQGEYHSMITNPDKLHDLEGIIIKLGDVQQLNHIRMLLVGKEREDYSYYVEISQDQDIWERVIDYSAYRCRSWQSLYFETRPVRYIRIVGTESDPKLVSFEAKYVQNVPMIHNQIVKPNKNIASLEMGAKVIAGSAPFKAHSVDVLLNGDLNYDCCSGYIYHPIGNGSIIIQLAQPYIIGSMRIFLPNWDMDSFSFKIETSLEGEKWEMAVDKRDSWEWGWVYSTIDPRPTVFIRIIGIRKDGYALCIVHFECSSTSSQ